jgi:ABC-type sulfate transport system substrate-binding protein
MNGKVLIVIGFVAAVGAILYFNSRKGDSGKPAGPGKTVELNVLYSTEKKEWIEAATAAFAKARPDVTVKLNGKGSLDAAQAIVEGKEKPALWSPADSLVMALAASDWETKYGTRLVAAEGSSDAPQALVLTPLVFVVWEDRADVLLKSGRLSWHSLHDAVSSNRGWPAVGGKAEWGFVKLGHTDPTKSNSGLEALLLMTLEYYKKTGGLTVAELLDPKYQEWVKDIERGVGQFGASTGTFMNDMIRFGPSRYDIAVVYENLAASQIENAQGRWGNLKIYYPSTTVWSDHPIALLQGDWISDEQKSAARAYVQHLRSRPIQEQALAFGFRPADASVPVKTADPHNPFVRLTQYGIQVEVPTAATPPDPSVVRNLITMWSRVVAQR